MHFKRFLTLILLPGVIFSQKIDDNALKSLIAKTKETHSSALTIYFDDKLIFNECFDSLYSPIDAMSCTKSFVNLGIGLLISKGKIQSIDEPVYKYYPEWNQGLKRKITIRNLLNHTSGIQTLPNTSEIYRSPDYVQFALTADIVDTPGTKFFYNNNAVNILAGIIQKASGERMDKYIRDNIFKPLNIHDFYWQTDAYRYNGMKDTAYLSRGNPIGMAELMIKAEDMAKVGLLVLHNGNLNGTQIIQEKWIEESMKPGQVYNLTCGLLWWLIYDPATIPVSFTDSNINILKAIKLNDTLLNALLKVKGQYKSIVQFSANVDSVMASEKLGNIHTIITELRKKSYFVEFFNADYSNSKIIGYAARGYLGQYIDIFPEKKLVVVRTIQSHNYKSASDQFEDFDIMSLNIVR